MHRGAKCGTHLGGGAWEGKRQETSNAGRDDSAEGVRAQGRSPGSLLKFSSP